MTISVLLLLAALPSTPLPATGGGVSSNQPPEKSPVTPAFVETSVAFPNQLLFVKLAATP